VEGEEICAVEEFAYTLGPCILLRTVGALRKAVFLDRNLTLSIYVGLCVVTGECWVPLRKHLKKLNTYFTISAFGLSWVLPTGRNGPSITITMAEMRQRWGLREKSKPVSA
jgi:hypothetical protein